MIGDDKITEAIALAMLSCYGEDATPESLPVQWRFELKQAQAALRAVREQSK